MAQDQRLLQQKLGESQESFDRLSQKLEALKKRFDIETRPEEKLRLEHEIRDAEAERDKVAAELESLEAALEKQRLVQEASRLERIKSYTDAIKVWQKIQALSPEDEGYGQEIERLESKRQRSQGIADYIKRLAPRFRDIEPVFEQVLQRLNQIKEAGAEDDGSLGLVEAFLTGSLPAEGFITAWKALTGVTPSSAEAPDYAVLAERLRRGEIVLFLGSDAPHLLDADAPDADGLVSNLAQQVNFGSFSGSLAKISQYYQMTDYGRSTLVRNLQKLVTLPLPGLSLYEILARIEQPLILISAGYDTLLEDAFHTSGKNFALVSPIVQPTSSYEIGSLYVQYSDREKPEPPDLEQRLSELDPLGKGYSLIFKIRGCCKPETMESDQDDILTLSEENFFDFARYTDELIPKYLVKQLRNRGLYFLGYAPRHWEDRLIANAILSKRRPQDGKATAITTHSDPFELAFWDYRNVRIFRLELREFVRKLEAQFS